MNDEKLGDMLNNLYLFHRFLRKNGFKYEDLDGRKKMTFSHYLTLLLLKRRGELSIYQIKALIGANKQNMTRIMDALVEKGLIKRLPNMSDRRVINIVITDKGDNYLDVWNKNKVSEINKIFTIFDDEDLDKIRFSIENIKNIILKIEDKID